MKIIFKPMSLIENINVIKEQCNMDMNVYNYMPELKSIQHINNSQEREKKIESIVKQYYNKYIQSIEVDIIKYNYALEQYSKDYVDQINKYLNIQTMSLNILIKVGIIPTIIINPEGYTFSIPINLNDETFTKLFRENIFTLLYLYKLKKLNSDIEQIESTNQCIPYIYQEIVKSILFNENINYDKEMVDKIRKIYNSNDSIENKINSGYKLISSKKYNR